MGLTKIAITRPIFIFMLVLLSVFAGLFALQRMRVEENPEVQFGVITVSTIYPGAGPEEVSTLVSRKVEEAISGVNGLLELTSSSQEGVSVVVGQFEIGTNMDVALNDVRAKVDGVVGELPREVEKPTVSKIDASSTPVMTLNISSEKLNPQQLRDLSEDKIKDRFARIRGVSIVGVSGGDEREVQVRLKNERLISYGLGIVDVQRALAGSSLNVPSGRMVTPDNEFSVRVIGEFRKPEDIGNTILRFNDQQQFGVGKSVKLNEIAEVVDTAKEKRTFTRLNGQDSVILEVSKAREGNAVEISRAALDEIKRVETEYGVKINVTEDTAVRVNESIFDLNFALLFGIILVTAIVHLFLHDWRGTLIVALAIPICLMATLMVLWMLGFTLNSMSMLAMSLAIGVLVDDAIVVLENIYRHLKLGEDPATAALNGRGEIGLAAIAITLADVVVFLPMGFMGGVVGQFFKPLGIGFAVAVMLSLFVSFTVTPMLASRWYKSGEDVEEERSRFAKAFDRGFERFERGYRRTLEWSLNHRWFVFIAGFTILLGVFMFIGGSFADSAAAAMKNTQGMVQFMIMLGAISALFASIKYRKLMARPLWGAVLFALVLPLFAATGYAYRQWKGEDVFKFSFAPSSDQGTVLVKIETAPGTSLSRTLEVVKQVEQQAMKNPDVHYVLSNVGRLTGSFAGTGGSRGSNLASVTITLYEKEAILDKIMFWKKHEERLRSISDKSVAADLTVKLGKIPGTKLIVSTQDGFGFGSPIQMSFRSDDRQLLASTAQEVVNRLSQGAVEGVISPDLSSKPGKPEFRVVPNRERMSDADVTTSELANVMRMLYEGNDDVKMRVQGREYPVRVMMDLEDRNNPAMIDLVPVAFDRGSPIFLPQVAEIVESATVDKVDRRSRQDEIQVTAELLPGYAAGSVQAKIDEWLAKEKLLPDGVSLKPLGQADVQARETQYLMTTLLIGLVLVFMILASLYDNLLYPFIIQLAQPQAFVGALLALILTDKGLNIVGFIGLIALVGLVGKNAILLVDYTNTLRGRGLNRHDALVQAGPTRLRPIMMTTLAILLGMLPVALAIGRGSEFRETLGIIIIGGITLSTLLTLLVIPCSYTIFDDLSDLIARWRGKTPGSSSSLPELEPEPSLN